MLWRSPHWPREHRDNVRGVSKMCVPCYPGLSACAQASIMTLLMSGRWWGEVCWPLHLISSSVTHRAWEGTVAMTDSAYSLVMTNLSPGAAEAVKPGEQKTRKENVRTRWPWGPCSWLPSISHPDLISISKEQQRGAAGGKALMKIQIFSIPLSLKPSRPFNTAGVWGWGLPFPQKHKCHKTGASVWQNQGVISACVGWEPGSQKVVWQEN